MPKPSTLGDHLKASRARSGLSLRAIEKRAGVNSGYLSQLERNEIKNPNPTVLQKLSTGYEEPFLVLMQWAGYVEEGISPNAQRALSVLGDNFTDNELEVLKAVLDTIRSGGTAAFSPIHRTDLTLSSDELTSIRKHALAVLRESDNLGDAPVDLEAAMAAAQLVQAGGIELTLEEKKTLRRRFGGLVDWALKQLQGMVHLDANEVFVSPDLHEMRRRFVLGHEVGHAVLPDHRTVFAHLDDKTRLQPDFSDLLERQANQFSIELLAKGDRLREEFDDYKPGASVLSLLHSKYELSLQAVARRVAEQSKRPIAVAIAHIAHGGEGQLMPARIYCSASFDERMGWSAAPPRELIQDCARRGRQGVASEQLLLADAAEHATVLHSETLDTRYATIVLFWPETKLTGVRRVNPFVRARK